MKNLVHQQQEFNEKFKFTPDNMNIARLMFRHELAQEETDELLEALANSDSDGIVDALVDQIYIAIGTLNMLGVDANKAFTEVHMCNMQKDRGVNAKRNMVTAYDVVKPKGWQGPSHLNNLGILDKLLGNT